MADPLFTPEELRELALAPKDATSGTKRVVSRDIKDIIAAAEYIKSQNRSRTRNPLRAHQLSPPGTQ